MRNIVTCHCRIINSEKVRTAWGAQEKMEKAEAGAGKIGNIFENLL